MSIRIEHTEVVGFEHAIRGMRNPLNSWDKSDSEWYWDGIKYDYSIGHNDLELMKKLVKAGTDHRKFMRMITVYVDVTAPMYWFKEMDTYKVGTVRNSCSTMHKITEKEFTLDDFSREQLFTHDFQSYDVYDNEEQFQVDFRASALEILNLTIQALNNYRKAWLNGNKTNKKLWWQLIQLLPSSYNQRATVQLNYAVLQNIYHSRRNHRLDEWRDFCRWIETLPYSELITGGNADEM